MTIYLTDNEIQKVLDACNGYIEMMGDGEDTCDVTNYMLETGLGSALRKISKGRNWQFVYAKYNTVSQCPTFDEWKAARANQVIW